MKYFRVLDLSHSEVTAKGLACRVVEFTDASKARTPATEIVANAVSQKRPN
jgi:hypothetical protein